MAASSIHRLYATLCFFAFFNIFGPTDGSAWWLMVVMELRARNLWRSALFTILPCCFSPSDIWCLVTLISSLCLSIHLSPHDPSSPSSSFISNSSPASHLIFHHDFRLLTKLLIAFSLTLFKLKHLTFIYGHFVDSFLSFFFNRSLHIFFSMRSAR